MKNILTLLLLITTHHLYAQKDTTWFDKDWERVSTKDSAKYFRPTVRKMSDDRYLVKNYYLSNGRLQMEGTSLDSNGDTGDGQCKGYYENGQLESEGILVKGTNHGQWIFYYESGTVSWKTQYRSSFFHGEVIKYYKNGIVNRREKWKNGIMKSGVCYTKNGKDTTYYEDNSLPRFPGGDKLYERYMLERMVYPEYCKKNKIHGRVYVNTYFDETGKIYRTHISTKNHPLLDEEALRLILGMPQWQPAIDEDGHPVKGERNVDVLFGKD